MANHIVSAEIKILDGILDLTIAFGPHLNIISGENGTMKTKLLQSIGRSQHIDSSLPPHLQHREQVGEYTTLKLAGQSPLRVYAISPKRNSERKTVEAIFQQLRSGGGVPQAMNNDRMNAIIEDQTFRNYPSFGELFYKVYDEKNMAGNNQSDNMNSTAAEFNNILQKVFPDYSLVTNWDTTTGRPDVHILKKKMMKVPLEGLSLGEQEVLSIILNLYYNSTRYDVFLIDEPEIHLNWHLEEKLFYYFDWFAHTQNKQLVIITHSRAIFNSHFLAFTQFLYWGEDGKIRINRELSDDLRKKIAGEAIEIIKISEFDKKVFFTEDNSHRKIIETLAQALGKNVHVTICGNSANVKSFYKYSLLDGGWEKAVFVTDGDNEGNPYPGDERFIHLDKYSIENYFLNLNLAAQVLNKATEIIQQDLLEITLATKNKMFSKYKYLEFLIDRLLVTDIDESLLGKLDGSILLPKLCEKYKMDSDTYIEKYIALAMESKSMENFFPKNLLDHLGSA